MIECHGFVNRQDVFRVHKQHKMNSIVLNKRLRATASGLSVYLEPMAPTQWLLCGEGTQSGDSARYTSKIGKNSLDLFEDST